MPSKREGLEYDSWLADIFGRDVYRVSVLDHGPTGEAAPVVDRQLRDAQSGKVFMYAKLGTSAASTVAYLESLGFALVDTNVLFAKPTKSSANCSGGSTVRSAGSNDRAKVVQLARRSFVYSRFHLDPAVPKAVADTIKARWVESCFLGDRGDRLLVAVAHGEVVGFCMLLRGDDGVVTVDLIAVDADHRGRGMAGDMIVKAESEWPGCTEIRVGTQLANVPSIRCYERLGFRLHSAQYVLHYHNPPGYGK